MLQRGILILVEGECGQPRLRLRAQFEVGYLFPVIRSSQLFDALCRGMPPKLSTRHGLRRGPHGILSLADEKPKTKKITSG
jgi:hypothetical protein